MSDESDQIFELSGLSINSNNSPTLTTTTTTSANTGGTAPVQVPDISIEATTTTTTNSPPFQIQVQYQQTHQQQEYTSRHDQLGCKNALYYEEFFLDENQMIYEEQVRKTTKTQKHNNTYKR